MKRITIHIFSAVLFAAATLRADEHYRVEQVEVPQGIVMEVSGMDYSPDGVLYLATRRGDVWTRKDGAWQRFAHGLHEPMGLCIGSKGEVFVSQRPEITQLIDENGDGVADLHRTISDEFSMVPNFHQYTYGLVQDDAGNLWGTLSGSGKTNPDGRPASANGFSAEPYRMWSFKVSPEGEFVPWSSGLRTANGIGMNDEGDLFATDNQGDWVGSSMLHHLEQGVFHGHPDALRWDPRFKDKGDPTKLPIEELDRLRKMPAVFLPHGELSNSPGAPLCDTTRGEFGPFAGQFFIGDVVHATLMRVALEKVNGQYQGACFPFIKGSPQKVAEGGEIGEPLKAGICRLAFAPDHSLMIGRVGEGNWNRGLPGTGVQRVVYTGVVPFEIHRIELQQDGFKLHFTKPLNPADKLSPEQFALKSYHYAYTPKYGSPKIDLKDLPVTAVEISADGMTAALRVLRLEKRKIYQFSLKGITDASGKVLRNASAYYTLNELKE